MSTFAANSDRSLLPGGEALVSNYRDQARVLHDAGVDLFAPEMLFDIDVSLAMFEAAAGFELPVIMVFTCNLTDSGEPGVLTASGMGYPGMPLEQVLRTVIDSIDTNNVIFSIMHSEAETTDAALKVLKTSWDGPITIYPNSGQFIDLRMRFDSICSPDEFQLAASRWVDAGEQIIGDCCGIGPAHIERLTQSIRG